MSRTTVGLVTGGGTGLGHAIAIALASAGSDVVVNYSRSASEAEEVVRQIHSIGRQAMAIRADVSVESQVVEMIQAVIAEFGRLDFLIANAGTTVFRELTDLEGVSESDWDRIIGVNLKGPWFCAKHAAPYLKKQGGHIITISSTAGLMTMGSSIPYCVSKAGLIHLTRLLAKALAPEIQVNSVAPGLLDTRWGRQHGEAGIKAFVEKSPLRRVPSLDDVAAQVLTIIRSSSTTGQTIVIDAGLTL